MNDPLGSGGAPSSKEARAHPVTAARPCDLTVVVVTRNTCSLTCAALLSVEESRDDLRKSVVVVDNASSDDTLRRLPQDFPQVRYLRSPVNLGFAKACNLGARESRGEFVLLLNSDARLKTDALAQAVDWMRCHPQCGIVGGQLLNSDGSLQNSISNFPSLATELLNKSLLRRLFPRRFPGKENHFSEPVEVESVIGAFMLIRRSVWEQLGGLDERFFFFLEETDFCLQARRRGWTTWHLPQAQVWHAQGSSAGQEPAAARIEYWRARYAYFAKNHALAIRLLLRLGLGLRLAVDWAAAGLLGLLTLGKSTRWVSKWRLQSALWTWHLRGCPASAGLSRC